METTTTFKRIALVMHRGLYREALAHAIRTRYGPATAVMLDNGAAYEAAYMNKPAPSAVFVHLGIDPEVAIRTIAWISRAHPATLPLACGRLEAQALVDRALQAGSRGYLADTAETEDIMAALDELLRTGRCTADAWKDHEHSLAAQLLQRQMKMDLISRRELDVLRLLGHPDDLSYKLIADRLQIGPRTVETHVRRLRGKLGSKTRTGLLLVAYKWGLLSMG